MKKISIALVMAAILVACKTNDKKSTGTPLTPEQVEQAKNDPSKYTTIEWIDPVTKELGKLVKDQKIEISYRFKNSGQQMLVIEDVRATCGCTIPKKPEQPFAPGEEGVIRAEFNGSGQGPVSKTIVVVANTKPQKEHNLTFKGEIEGKEEH